MKTRLSILILPFFLLLTARAQSTSDLPDAATEGSTLVQKILAQPPAENFTNTGVLEIRDQNDRRTKLPVTCETVVTPTHWTTRYEAKPAGSTNTITLVVTHAGTEPNQYQLYENGAGVPVSHFTLHAGMTLSGNHTFIPFAGSDFWLADLGLEFFHWPAPKVLKKEFYNNCACAVLECTNPDPTNGYSRVVCWVDEESLGIVKACAYDANGQKLKYFHPKSLVKVNGQYRVESMDMENLQTGSTSRIEFNFDPPATAPVAH